MHRFPGYEPTAVMPSVPDVLDGTGGANTAAVRVNLEPGTKERYSGGGTTILQLLLSEVARKPFPDVLAEWVLSPLGMTDSAFDQPPRPDRVSHAAARRSSRAPRGCAMARLSGARRRRPVDDAARPLTARDRGVAGAARRERSFADRGVGEAHDRRPRASARSHLGVRVCRIAAPTERARRLVLRPQRRQLGISHLLLVDREQGHGFAAMINGSDFNLLLEVQRRVARAYEWKGDFTKPPRNWPVDR